MVDAGTDGKEGRKEVCPEPGEASFLPSQAQEPGPEGEGHTSFLPKPEGKSADEEGREAVVIVEASGGMGTGGGAARPPYPPSSFKTAGRDDAGNLCIVECFDATDEPLPPQEPGESDGDHLERCLRAC